MAPKQVNWVEKYLGGRKYSLTVFGTIMTPVLALLHAPGDAYIALAGIIGTFNGANAVATWSTNRPVKTVKEDISPE